MVDFALTHLNRSPRGTMPPSAELTRQNRPLSLAVSPRSSGNKSASPPVSTAASSASSKPSRLIHRGLDVPWAELALTCGYYDQSHFANDFHAFSGLSPTAYSISRRPWSNHVSLD